MGSIPLLWLAEKGSSKKVCGRVTVLMLSFILHFRAADFSLQSHTQPGLLPAQGATQNQARFSQALQNTQPAQQHTDPLRDASGAEQSWCRLEHHDLLPLELPRLHHPAQGALGRFQHPWAGHHNIKTYPRRSRIREGWKGQANWCCWCDPTLSPF